MANQNIQPVIRKLPFTLSLLAAGCLLFGGAAQGQTLKARFPLNDAPGSTTSPSDASTGGASASLSMTNSANAAADFHGAVGTGVSGLSRALDFSLPADFTSGAGEGAQAGTGPLADCVSTALNFGAVSNFTAVIWFKGNANLPTTGGNVTLGPRIFTLGTSGVTDKGAANSIGLFYQTTNLVAFTLNAVQINAPAFPGTFVPTGEWLYFAITYDGTNDVAIYEGTDSTPAVLVTNTTVTTGTSTGVGVAAQLITLGGAGSTLQVGNRANGRTRSFDGWINDFRFYTGTGTANFVEDIRWSDVAPTNVIAVTGNDQVGLTWSALNGAASYNVKVSTNNGGPYSIVATNVTDTSYTDTTALNGTTYYYVISAINTVADATESGNSTSVIAALTPPPTVPTITSAVPGNAQVIVSLDGLHRHAAADHL